MLSNGVTLIVVGIFRDAVFNYSLQMMTKIIRINAKPTELLIEYLGLQFIVLQLNYHYQYDSQVSQF